MAAAAVAGFFVLPWLGLLFVGGLAFLLFFFRDPERKPGGPDGALLAPADGRIVEIASGEEPEHIGGPAAKIAIFMSLMNVHVNRCPCAATVEWVRHAPGRFHNALKPEASVENEMAVIALRDSLERPVLVKLIAGVVARRITCPLRPGDAVERGQRIGMVKFGSRVELYIPVSDRFHLTARLGERVRAGETILGMWK